MRMPETAVEVTEADDGDLFLRVLDQALDALNRAEIPFLLIGGIGSAVYGRDQGTRDIDVFVRPETARKVLDDPRRSEGSRRRRSPSAGCPRRSSTGSSST